MASRRRQGGFDRLDRGAAKKGFDRLDRGAAKEGFDRLDRGEGIEFASMDDLDAYIDRTGEEVPTSSGIL